MNRIIKAAFFDVDGTLFSHASQLISPGTKQCLEDLRSRGIKTFLCTGRHITELDLLPVAAIRFDGYITLNGHICLDEKRNMIYSLPFPEDTTRSLINAFREHQLPLILVEESGQTLHFVNNTIVRARKTDTTSVSEAGPYDGQPIYQAMTFAESSEDEFIRAILPPDCHAARWNDFGVDLLLNGGGKVAGIRHVLEYEGILPEECIPFGDAENDMDMIEFCGIGVAMGNAQEKVKDVADYVTADVDDDGIEKALRFYGIL